MQRGPAVARLAPSCRPRGSAAAAGLKRSEYSELRASRFAELAGLFADGRQGDPARAQAQSDVLGAIAIEAPRFYFGPDRDAMYHDRSEGTMDTDSQRAQLAERRDHLERELERIDDLRDVLEREREQLEERAAELDRRAAEIDELLEELNEIEEGLEEADSQI